MIDKTAMTCACNAFHGGQPEPGKHLPCCEALTRARPNDPEFHSHCHDQMRADNEHRLLLARDLAVVQADLATARTRIAELEGETLARWNAINESLAENRDLSRRLQLAVGALDSLVGQLEEARLYEIPGGQKVSRTPAWCGLGPGKRQLLERFIADMRAAISPPPAEPQQTTTYAEQDAASERSRGGRSPHGILPSEGQAGSNPAAAPIPEPPQSAATSSPQGEETWAPRCAMCKDGGTVQVPGTPDDFVLCPDCCVCKDNHDGWECTQPYGHDGDHWATVGGDVVYAWHDCRDAGRPLHPQAPKCKTCGGDGRIVVCSNGHRGGRGYASNPMRCRGDGGTLSHQPCPECGTPNKDAP